MELFEHITQNHIAASVQILIIIGVSLLLGYILGRITAKIKYSKGPLYAPALDSVDDEYEEEEDEELNIINDPEEFDEEPIDEPLPEPEPMRMMPSEIIDTPKPTPRRRPAPRRAPVKAVVKSVPAEKPPVKVVMADFTKLEGIGPKIKDLLRQANILSWNDLAASRVATLRKILEEAGPRYRVHDPSTWAQQARYARDERWSELRAFQKELKGGKKPAKTTPARKPAKKKTATRKSAAKKKK